MGKTNSTCHWDENLPCDYLRICAFCEHQPDDNDKRNGRKAPVRIAWEVFSDGDMFPMCPACGEMPYSLARCVFCGQKFVQDDPLLQLYAKPDPEERRDCPACGGIRTIVGRHTKFNGHFHGRCEACGAEMVE